MQSSTYPSLAALEAAVAALTPAQRSQCQADISDGFVLRYPKAVAAAVAAIVPETAAAAQLAVVQSQLKAAVDKRAEALRLTLITPGSGQAMEYQEAYAEAVQVDAAGKSSQAINPTAFPMLSASLGFDVDPSTGKPTVDVAGEARAVLAAYDAYQKAGAAIRNARLKGKAAIDAALDAVGAQAAFAAIAWPALA